MVMHGNRQHTFGVALADYIIIENFADICRSWHTVCRLDQRAFVFLADDVHAQFNAFITDKYGRSRNKLADLVLALAAKGTIKGILGVTAAGLAHIGPVPYSNTDFRRNAANTVIYYGSRSSPLTTTQIWGSGTAHVLYLATIRDLILKIKARS
jgi:hypothetical protein